MIDEDCSTCRPISEIEADNSSLALATVWTLAEACSVAAATAVACRLVSSAVADMLSAVPRISVEAEASVLSACCTVLSKVAM